MGAIHPLEHFDFDLSQETRRAIEDMGYDAPTPIQALAIAPLLEGKDVIGQAQTGTGKTAAFGIPIIEKIDAADRTTQALVVCPTRELAVQTAGELIKLAKYRPGLNVLAVYGGQPIERQLRPLKMGVQIVVGTPGRVMDHLNRGTLSLDGVKIAVLDEADEMLDMGFREDIESILSKTPETRQTALFSATMPLPILNLSQKYLKEPEILRVENKQMTVEAIRQTYIPIRSFHKVELLSRLLVRDGVTRALVFMNTKLGVEDVVTKLQARGFAAAGLHGDMRQIERDAIMERFKNGMVGILVATDVAARGLDIDNVEAVFNYDLPLDVEYYVHRIGRTGRAGREGRAYTFVVGRETSRMWDYRRVTKAAILCEQPPSGEDIKKAEDARLIEKATALATGEPDADALETARRLLENVAPENAVAALLTLLEASEGEKFEPQLDIRVPEPPKPAPRPVQAPAGRYGRPADGRSFARRGDGSVNRDGRPAFRGNGRRAFSHDGEPTREDGKPAFRSAAHGEGRRPMNRDNNAPFADRAPREGGKPAFRSSAHGEGRRPMNRENNAPFADRAPREDGKPAFRGSAHGEGKPAFRRDSENRPPRKPKGSVRSAQPSGSQEFAVNPPYRPWENTRKKSPRKPRNS